jgi:hypothetical protein
MIQTSNALNPQSPQARAIYDLAIDWARFFGFDLGGMTLLLLGFGSGVNAS